MASAPAPAASPAAAHPNDPAQFVLPPPERGEGRVVEVTEVALSTTATQLRNFLSFCGEIRQFQLTNLGDRQTALVEFERESAASTALLLSNARLNGSDIVVSLYYPDPPSKDHGLAPPDDEGSDSEDEAESGEVFVDAREAPVEEEEGVVMLQEDKPKLSIMVELLANGYVLNDRILERAKEFDEKRGISERFKEYLISAHNKGTELNEKYRVMETGQELAARAGEKAKELAYEIDGRYHVKDKLVVAKEEAQRRAVELDQKYHVVEKVGAAKQTAVKYAGQAMATETGQRISNFLGSTWRKAKVINDEAKQRAVEKERESEQGARAREEASEVLMEEVPLPEPKAE